MSVRHALWMGTYWGGAVIPTMLVMQQKAYSGGSLWAITSALLFQVLSTREQPGSGNTILAAALVLFALIAVWTWEKHRQFRRAHVAWLVRARDSRGEVADAARVLDSDTSAGLVVLVGQVYGLRRRRGEPIEQFRQRLAAHIRKLAEGVGS